MNELVFKSYAEQRENSVKFIYFLFSTTIITLGFCMTLSKGMIPTWWSLLWGLSVVLMFLSLYFGYRCIQNNHKVLGYLGIQYLVNQQLVDLLNKDINLIKNHILEIKSLNITPTSLMHWKEWVVIELSKNKSDIEFRSYILNSNRDNLISEINRLQLAYISRAQKLPIDNNDDFIAKVYEIDKESVCYFNRQLRLLSIGFVILFFWYVTSFSYV
ncbi:TPA: hypothetical protein P0O03_003867 [Yersinia enterocolitica]|nr:hypothetical protein [Yersinia enterocolitica]